MRATTAVLIAASLHATAARPQVPPQEGQPAQTQGAPVTPAAAAQPAKKALAKPSTPETPLAVRAEGAVATGAVRGSERRRYRLTPPSKGTLIVSLQPVHGASPRAKLLSADGRVIRRERNGQLWARTRADVPLILEVSARAPDQPGVYLVRAVFDVDRPREERDRPRPARPGDIVLVSRRGQVVERVLVDGIAAEFKQRGPDVLVTIPAFARTGRVELEREGAPADELTIALIGTEPARPDLAGDACGALDREAGAQPAVPGCVRLALSPAVGAAWLEEIARVVDADLVAHSQATGAAVLKLRLTGTEEFALATLRAMPGIRAATR